MQDVRDNKLFSNLSVLGGGLLILIAIGAIVYLSLQRSGYFLDKKNKDKNLIASVKYVCDNKKTLVADFFVPKTSMATSTSSSASSMDIGQDPALTNSPSAPIPVGSVVLKLDDGRNFDLNQTVSADGGRYTNKDESFVFWDKGDTVMILEFDTEKNYTGCKKYDPIVNSYTNLVSYLDPTYNFTIKYPKDYSQDKKYQYTNLGPGKSINGIKFTIPKIYTNGNNLSSDSYFSVENILNSKSCSASLFLDNVISQNISVNGSDYSFASSTSAGAGNRYEEHIYAFPKNNVCFAVRYFIHYSVIENYPAGIIVEFNKDNLLKEFDAIRDSLNFSN